MVLKNRLHLCAAILLTSAGHGPLLSTRSSRSAVSSRRGTVSIPGEHTQQVRKSDDTLTNIHSRHPSLRYHVHLNIVYLWLVVAIVQIGKGSLPNNLLTSQLLERGPLNVRVLPVQHTAVQDGARVGLLVANEGIHTCEWTEEGEGVR